MSPKIPVTASIASPKNVSGLNMDVGSVLAQTSSTCSIPNISITPIPLNPTNTQMHVCKVTGITPKISSKTDPQDFLLNPSPTLVESQETFGKSKNPSLNIPSGYQVHVGHEKLVDGWKQKTPL
ncbi:hypothetical protein O181_057126 [Austropuccinia psidii MF-1]|uniref:Uncharacterized protein n=1 Tax=Austropuccinia psidii MF-1 TaxID=1389203 RepID=A0A9Q3E7P9_9BASI|nr:hypothetical protein [Austropuccinia psidii MF-1]